MRGARQQREDEEALVAEVEADPQPSAAQQPGDGALNRPAVAAQPLGELDPTPSNDAVLSCRVERGGIPSGMTMAPVAMGCCACVSALSAGFERIL
jgi:hypothetical protein